MASLTKYFRGKDIQESRYVPFRTLHFESSAKQNCQRKQAPKISNVISKILKKAESSSNDDQIRMAYKFEKKATTEEHDLISAAKELCSLRTILEDKRSTENPLAGGKRKAESVFVTAERNYTDKLKKGDYKQEKKQRVTDAESWQRIYTDLMTNDNQAQVFKCRHREHSPRHHLGLLQSPIGKAVGWVPMPPHGQLVGDKIVLRIPLDKCAPTFDRFDHCCNFQEKVTSPSLCTLILAENQCSMPFVPKRYNEDSYVRNGRRGNFSPRQV